MVRAIGRGCLLGSVLVVLAGVSAPYADAASASSRASTASLHRTAVAPLPPEPSGFPPPWMLSGPEEYWRTNLFARVWRDQAFLVREWWLSELTRPRVLVPLLIATAVASRAHSSPAHLDRRIVDRLSGPDDPLGPTASVTLTRMGNAALVAAFLGTGYLSARAAHADRFARACSLGAEALLDGGLWTVLLKRTAARIRPSRGGTGAFFRYRHDPRYAGGSFPSGHAMTAFAVATVFAHEYRDRKWVPWVAYGAASLVALSRVVRRQHFPTDVVAGALLGNSMGRMVGVRAHGAEPRAKEREGPPALGPLIDPATGRYGVALTLGW